MMKFLSTIVFLFLVVGSLAAQSNAPILISVDKNILNLAQRKLNIPFLQEMEQKVFDRIGGNSSLFSQIYEAPTELGLSEQNHLVGFVDQVADELHFGLQFPIADAGLFKAQLERYAAQNLVNVLPIDSTITDEGIRTALLEQRAARIEQRRALLQIHYLSENEVHYINLNDWVLAWTKSEGFLIKTNVVTTSAEVGSTYYQNLQTQLEAAQQTYLTKLTTIKWQDLSHHCSVQITEAGTAILNQATEATKTKAPLHLLFDQAILLSKATHYLYIDFEKDAIQIQLNRSEAIRYQKKWTKSDLVRNRSNINIASEDDSLAVLFKVWGSRLPN